MNRWICLTDDEIRNIIKLEDVDLKIKSKLQKSQKHIKTSSAKAKGRNLQKWVCERLSTLLNIPYDQSDDSCLIHSREMGQHGTDIILRGEAAIRFPFAIECKNQEQLSLTAAIKQAEANAKDKWWMVVIKNKAVNDPVVCLSWSTFEILYKDVLS